MLADDLNRVFDQGDMENKSFLHSSSTCYNGLDPFSLFSVPQILFVLFTNSNLNKLAAIGEITQYGEITHGTV